ncbi:hypothetical protein ACFFRR_010842 [Megaselia abdita]
MKPDPEEIQDDQTSSICSSDLELSSQMKGEDFFEEGLENCFDTEIDNDRYFNFVLKDFKTENEESVISNDSEISPVLSSVNIQESIVKEELDIKEEFEDICLIKKETEYFKSINFSNMESSDIQQNFEIDEDIFTIVQIYSDDEDHDIAEMEVSSNGSSGVPTPRSLHITKCAHDSIETSIENEKSQSNLTTVGHSEMTENSFKDQSYNPNDVTECLCDDEKALEIKNEDLVKSDLDNSNTLQNSSPETIFDVNNCFCDDTNLENTLELKPEIILNNNVIGQTNFQNDVTIKTEKVVTTDKLNLNSKTSQNNLLKDEDTCNLNDVTLYLLNDLEHEKTLENIVPKNPQNNFVKKVKTEKLDFQDNLNTLVGKAKIVRQFDKQSRLKTYNPHKDVTLQNHNFTPQKLKIEKTENNVLDYNENVPYIKTEIVVRRFDKQSRLKTVINNKTTIQLDSTLPLTKVKIEKNFDLENIEEKAPVAKIENVDETVYINECLPFIVKEETSKLEFEGNIDETIKNNEETIESLKEGLSNEITKDICSNEEIKEEEILFNEHEEQEIIEISLNFDIDSENSLDQTEDMKIVDYQSSKNNEIIGKDEHFEENDYENVQNKIKNESQNVTNFEKTVDSNIGIMDGVEDDTFEKETPKLEDTNLNIKNDPQNVETTTDTEIIEIDLNDDEGEEEPKLEENKEEETYLEIEIPIDFEIDNEEEAEIPIEIADSEKEEEGPPENLIYNPSIPSMSEKTERKEDHKSPETSKKNPFKNVHRKLVLPAGHINKAKKVKATVNADSITSILEELEKEEEFKDIPDENAKPHNLRETHNFDFFQYNYNKFRCQKNQFFCGNDNIKGLLEDLSKQAVESARKKSKSPVPSTSKQAEEVKKPLVGKVAPLIVESNPSEPIPPTPKVLEVVSLRKTVPSTSNIPPKPQRPKRDNLRQVVNKPSFKNRNSRRPHLRNIDKIVESDRRGNNTNPFQDNDIIDLVTKTVISTVLTTQQLMPNMNNLNPQPSRGGFDLDNQNQSTRAYIQIASRLNQSLIFRNYVHIINYLEEVEFNTEFENSCFFEGSIFILTDYNLGDAILKMIDLVELPDCPPLKGRPFQGELPRLCEIITVNVECALMNENLIYNHSSIIMNHIKRLVYIPMVNFEFSRNMVEVFFGSELHDAEKFIHLVDSFNAEKIGSTRLKGYVSNTYTTVTMACDFNIEEAPMAIAQSYSKINVLEWVFGNACIKNGSISCNVKVPNDVSKYLLRSRCLHVQLNGGYRGEIVFYL